MAKTALPGQSRLTAFAVDPDELTIVGLDTKDGPEHPLYDERIGLPVEDAFVRNIQEYGVLEPVLVRRSGDAIEVLDGRQRVRGAREAKRRQALAGELTVKVPVMVRRDDGFRAMGVMLSANEHRRADESLVKARKAQRMLDQAAPEATVANALGVSVAHLRNLLKLLELAPPVQKLVEVGKLAPTAAVTLVDLPRKEQAPAAQKLVEAGAPVAEAQRQARVRKTGESSPVRGKGPSKKEMRRILASLRETRGEPTLTPMRHVQVSAMVSTLAWVLGEEDAGEALALCITAGPAVIREEKSG